MIRDRNMSITETIDGTEGKISVWYLSTIFGKQCWDHLASLCWYRNDTKHRKKKGLGKCKGWAVVEPNRCQLHSLDKPLSQILRLYACYATNKCSNQVQQTNWGLYYCFLTFARSRASYSQTFSDTKPVAPRLRETGMPRIPAQRSRRSLLEYGTA